MNSRNDYGSETAIYNAIYHHQQADQEALDNLAQLYNSQVAAAQQDEVYAQQQEQLNNPSSYVFPTTTTCIPAPNGDQYYLCQSNSSPILDFLRQHSVLTQPGVTLGQEYKQEVVTATPARRRSMLPTDPQQKPRKINERQEFLVFIKVLFRFLKNNQDYRRLAQAKAIVAECTKRNRNGEAGYSHLTTAVESRLRRTVGECYWFQAKDYLKDYCRRRRIQQGQVAAV